MNYPAASCSLAFSESSAGYLGASLWTIFGNQWFPNLP